MLMRYFQGMENGSRLAEIYRSWININAFSARLVTAEVCSNVATSIAQLEDALETSLVLVDGTSIFHANLRICTAAQHMIHASLPISEFRDC